MGAGAGSSERKKGLEENYQLWGQSNYVDARAVNQGEDVREDEDWDRGEDQEFHVGDIQVRRLLDI